MGRPRWREGDKNSQRFFDCQIWIRQGSAKIAPDLEIPENGAHNPWELEESMGTAWDILTKVTRQVPADYTRPQRARGSLHGI